MSVSAELDYDAADVTTWGARNAHDPTVVRADDGSWYMFSTDAGAGTAESTAPAGVHMRHSTDLVNWEFTGTALPGVPGQAAALTGAPGLWAPEVVRWPANADGESLWHMYYSASTFGSNTSAIGLATAPDPAGPWAHQGLIVATEAGVDAQNAIDAAVTFDAEGQPWLTYGSFFAGIHTLRLSLSDGMPEVAGAKGSLIAVRDVAVEGSVEGAYVLYRKETGKYVLFASYGSLFDSYNVRVAVADSMEGPYRDALGASLTDLDLEPWQAGTKILGSWKFDGGPTWIAPGHNSVLVEQSVGGEEYFMVHHVRFADHGAAQTVEHTAHLRRMFFTDGGWPVVSPHIFQGADKEILSAEEPIAGLWQAARFTPESEETAESSRVLIRVLSGPEGSAGEVVRCRLALTAGGSGEPVTVDAVVFGAWDDSGQKSVLSFSGIDAGGHAWFGSKGD
ncbi:arabinan endo-1,5-alpha-L-arabinosidase [Arthrobacter psychrolactophilus]|uniref:Arabinan endo-1,5-alpha-L-arabinosidase n=1 Tax=Arthrobacter psychrolactophilus TaxID=92442 RepID=A0A2V5ITE1_9MICC|nr:arabinan endo-1,5-alpha-L-arabinosidase [Arthrobacter psychrolactophilus]